MYDPPKKRWRLTGQPMYKENMYFGDWQSNSCTNKRPDVVGRRSKACCQQCGHQTPNIEICRNRCNVLAVLSLGTSLINLGGKHFGQHVGEPSDQCEFRLETCCLSSSRSKVPNMSHERVEHVATQNLCVRCSSTKRRRTTTFDYIALYLKSHKGRAPVAETTVWWGYPKRRTQKRCLHCIVPKIVKTTCPNCGK